MNKYTGNCLAQGMHIMKNGYSMSVDDIVSELQRLARIELPAAKACNGLVTPDFDMITDALDDLAEAQENGILPPANQYPTAAIRAQIEALDLWQAARAVAHESAACSSQSPDYATQRGLSCTSDTQSAVVPAAMILDDEPDPESAESIARVESWNECREFCLRLNAEPSAVVPEHDLLLQDVANTICQHLPEGFEVRLCMENGAAWVELSDDHGDGRTLPEIDDVCLATQLNSALCAARGWTEQEQES